MQSLEKRTFSNERFSKNLKAFHFVLVVKSILPRAGLKENLLKMKKLEQLSNY